MVIESIENLVLEVNEFSQKIFESFLRKILTFIGPWFYQEKILQLQTKIMKRSKARRKLIKNKINKNWQGEKPGNLEIVIKYENQDSLSDSSHFFTPSNPLAKPLSQDGRSKSKEANQA